MATETIELEGHILDAQTLPAVLDLIIEAGAEYTIVQFTVGRSYLDPSRAVIEVRAEDPDLIERLLDDLHQHGANRVESADVTLEECDQDEVLPARFYSTTNLDTEIRLAGRWLAVGSAEMDCAIVVDADGARTAPMHRVRRGDRVVTGHHGMRVRPLAPSVGGSLFEFMRSDVSSEKPKASQVQRVADHLRAARERGERILVVAGPATIHTGGGPPLAAMVHSGWVDVLFAGNGFATHDMESNVYGTSLGVSVSGGSTEGGHSNHLRTINEIRRHGSIDNAVAAGYVNGGVMYECVRRSVPYVLAGSLRDDGPLPDTITDVTVAADRMRQHIPGVGVALMLAATLHAIATGNLLPARVATFCIDINAAVVTKLSDRGTHQALGVVTDAGPFVASLAQHLVLSPAT